VTRAAGGTIAPHVQERILELARTDELSIRAIARQLGEEGSPVSPSTVQRIKARSESGPQPVLSEQRPLRDLARNTAAAAAVLLVVLAALAVGLAWGRYLNPPAPRPGRVTACVHRSAAGALDGLAGGSRCPRGWDMVTLTPGTVPPG